MPQFLSTTDPGFEAAFTTLLGAKREDAPDVDAAVAAIIADVRDRGDAALIELTAKFDRLELTPETLAFSKAEIEAECARVDPDVRRALDLAHDRIRAYHDRQLPQDQRWTDGAGASLGWRWSPVTAAGLYVPGGLASYPSSVLMNAIPAKVAGVSRLVVTCPTPGGIVNPAVLYAARLAGVDRIYRIGGAQAIAALAYGTATIAPVDKITGPGNAYVAAAKRRVFGRVGIDMIAGPSEILVIADADNDPDWIALDLLSQAEHDESAQSILLTPDSAFAARVASAVEKRLETLERRAIAGVSWRDFGAIIITRDLAEAARPVEPRGSRAPRTLHRRPRGAGASDHPCRGDLPWCLHARSHRRLCRRPEPCPAHRPLCPLLLGPLGHGFPQAHHHRPHDPRGACRHRSRSRHARPFRKPRSPRPVGSGQT
jgi:histidinol dehydrogenase